MTTKPCSRDLNDVEQHFGGVNRAGRVVWIDDHNGFGVRRHFGANVVDRGIPVISSSLGNASTLAKLVAAVHSG